MPHMMKTLPCSKNKISADFSLQYEIKPELLRHSRWFPFHLCLHHQLAWTLDPRRLLTHDPSHSLHSPVPPPGLCTTYFPGLVCPPRLAPSSSSALAPPSPECSPHHLRLVSLHRLGVWGLLHLLAADPTLPRTSVFLSPRLPCQLPNDLILS